METCPILHLVPSARQFAETSDVVFTAGPVLCIIHDMKYWIMQSKEAYDALLLSLCQDKKVKTWDTFHFVLDSSVPANEMRPIVLKNHRKCCWVAVGAGKCARLKEPSTHFCENHNRKIALIAKLGTAHFMAEAS